jgi:hypothetical protein
VKATRLRFKKLKLEENCIAKSNIYMFIHGRTVRKAGLLLVFRGWVVEVRLDFDAALEIYKRLKSYRVPSRKMH